MKRLLCAALALLAACARPESPPRDAGEVPPAASPAPPMPVPPAPAPPAAPAQWVVTERGIGPVRAGMTIAEAGAALGAPVQPAYADFESCDHVRLPGGPAGVLLMIVNDTVARVETASTAVATAEGARVGDSEASVLSLYAGRVQVQPHEYTDGHYLVVTPRAAADSLFRIVFETDGRRVTILRAGLLPAVEWVEGCA